MSFFCSSIKFPYLSFFSLFSFFGGRLGVGEWGAVMGAPEIGHVKNQAAINKTSKVLIYPVIETVEQKYPQGANIPWTAPHHKNFSSDLENSSGDRDSCDPDTCLLNLPQPHSNPSPFTHHAAFFTVEIIQLTGRPPYKYPIHTQRGLSPTGRSPYKYPIHTPRSVSKLPSMTCHLHHQQLALAPVP